MNRKEQIFKEAAKLFRKKGYHKTSMKDISDNIGLLKGSLYYHIESKEDLLYQIALNAITNYSKPLENICSENIKPSKKLSKAVETHLTLICEHLDETAVLINEYYKLPKKLKKHIDDRIDEFESLFEKIIYDGIQEGEFRKFDLENIKIMSNGILGMCNSLVRWYSQKGRFSTKEIANQFLSMILYGLRQS
ncbi:MAG: TetR/AcrR family transcriptional regulator [Thermodesulfobacteriota bacterium]|nr:TetR/AcrR family transcriptional regulator [Thermodesulfobacteriota bacterium]